MIRDRQPFLALPRPSDPLAAALRACRSHFVAVALFSALMNLLVLVPMLYMLQIYDRVVPTRGVVTLLFLSLVLIFALATQSVLDLVRSRLLVRASVRLDRYLAGLTLETAFLQRSGGAEGRRAIRELDTLRQALGGPALIALADIPWSPLFVLICFLLHPLIGLLVAVGGGILVMVTFLNQRATSARLKEAGDASSRIYALQEEELVHANTIRALGMREAIVARHLQQRQSVLRLQSDAGLATSRYVSLSKFIRVALQSLSLGLGAWLAIGNEISVGAIFAASFLAGRALQPVDQMLASWSVLTRGMAAYSNVNAMLGQADKREEPTALPDPQGHIEVERLVVARPGSQSTILSGVSFEVTPGEVLAIAGPSGAGKSTLVRVMAGALAADLGEIRVDGAKQSSWDMDRLATFTGYVPQDPTLFAGSVKDNIARFQSGPDVDAMAVRAAQAAGAHDMIVRLPAGYDTPIQLGGGGLSAGQAQRIAIARALYGEPPIIIMDEPNAHLDAPGEAELVNTLASLKARGAAVVVVAHRAGILSAVDRILILRDGKIDKIGPRDEVLADLAPKKAPEPISITARRAK